ncbi:hypothetical protein Glove_275g2 [Diversispora epigaea]|uniref:Uncharacterized protein n=1 Tax=Diversispora epigaea TaxID=1348612 RepID=A0A397I551_9GLOM|nr:hypothetical protein Glove_275g2 [Diversispora epigaea]
MRQKINFALNSLIVNSGNLSIGNLIKVTLSSTSTSINSQFLKRVPYDEFTNIGHIGKCCFNQIYKETWKKNYYGTVWRVLNNSQNVDMEFSKEYIAKFYLLSIQDESLKPAQDKQFYALVFLFGSAFSRFSAGKTIEDTAC